LNGSKKTSPERKRRRNKMAKKKCCKSCKLFFEGSECPNCKSTNSTTNWHGRINILDSEKSEIGKRIGIKTAGEYAIKCR
jgi:DNA-directed RNA polymerase subunit E"